jgi:hypothetical protein
MSSAATSRQVTSRDRILWQKSKFLAWRRQLTKQKKNTRNGKMKSKIVQIENLHIEMKTLTLRAGVPEAQYNEAIQADELLTDEILTERLDFLKEVRQTTFAEAFKIWRLVPATTWDMYDLLGQKKLAEQLLLKKALKKLKKSWSDRYGRAPQPEETYEVEQEEDS